MDNQIIRQWLSYVGGGATILFLAGWVVKSWLEHKIKADVDAKYQKELEQFKQELSVKTNTAVETVKAKLATEGNQSQFRYSLYYKAMTETVINIHKSLVAAHTAIYDCIDCSFVNQSEDEAAAFAIKKENEFTESITHGQLYLNAKCHDLVWEIQRINVELFEIYRYWSQRIAEDTQSPELPKEHKEFTRQNYMKLCRGQAEQQTNERFQRAFIELQKEFKLLLGFKENAD